MPTTWTHCNVDIKILTKLSVDKADVDVISTHLNLSFASSIMLAKGRILRLLKIGGVWALTLALEMKRTDFGFVF